MSRLEDNFSSSYQDLQQSLPSNLTRTQIYLLGSQKEQQITIAMKQLKMLVDDIFLNVMRMEPLNSAPLGGVDILLQAGITNDVQAQF